MVFALVGARTARAIVRCTYLALRQEAKPVLILVVSEETGKVPLRRLSGRAQISVLTLLQLREERPSAANIQR
jgi:hypothetical protein